VHEVIDQGGEPIKVQEYFGVGRVTEFRYGIKVILLSTLEQYENYSRRKTTCRFYRWPQKLYNPLETLLWEWDVKGHWPVVSSP
jgi:hypothetical protein